MKMNLDITFSYDNKQYSVLTQMYICIII